MTSRTFEGTDRFTVKRCLGEGGFGIVYEAYDRVRRAPVALKLLSTTDTLALRRFKSEFRSLADIVHPRLVTLYELFCETPRTGEEDWFFTMKLVEGVDFFRFLTRARLLGEGKFSPFRLADVSTQQGPPPSSGPPESTKPPEPTLFEPDLDRLRPLMVQLAQGLMALHSRGMLHRDIKPSNVLVDSAGNVVLLDFGLVTTLAGVGGERKRGDIVGTPAYMAPEQAMLGNVTTASDWYSVGVMLYEALTAQLPLDGDIFSVLRAKQSVDPPKPSTIAKNVPPDLEALAMQLLSRDPAARPTGDEVLARLGERASSSVPTREASFVGRETELSLLRAAYAEVQRGGAVELLVRGRSGMGKSALVRRFLDELTGAMVLEARCYEQESVPYKALDGLIDRLAHELELMEASERAEIVPPGAGALARVFSSLRGIDGFWIENAPDPRELRRRASVALQLLLRNLARKAPLVLFIDDMHWGDLDSVRMLSEVMDGPDRPPLLLVIAHRSEDAERSPVLQPLRERDVRTIDVGELSAEDGRALMESIVPAQARDDRRMTAALRDAAGSPFFIEEIARHLDTYGGGAAVLDEVLRKRVEQLPPAARKCLEIVAVAGRPIARDLAVRIAELEADEPAVMAELRSGRLIRMRESGEIETFHDRVREVAVSTLVPDALRAHHRLLARALEAEKETDPERLATHWEHAGDLEKAGRWVVRAADVAMEALAFDRAARLYRKAIEMDQGDVRSLRARLGDALVNAGRGYDGARELVRAAEGADRIDALDLRRRGAEQFMLSGHIEEGKAMHKLVLDALDMRVPEARIWVLLTFLMLRAMLAIRGFGWKKRDPGEIDRERLLRMDTLWSLTIGMAIVDQMRALALQARHLLLALRTGEPSRLAHALAAEIAYCASRGVHARERVERLLPMARELAEERAEPLAMIASSEGLTLFAQARYREACEVMEKATKLLRECAGVTWHVSTAHAYWLFSQRNLGEMKTVVARYDELRREAEGRGDLYALTLLGTRLGHLGPLAADDVAGARSVIEEAIARWSTGGFTIQHSYAMVSRAECALYEDDAKGGLDRLDATWPALRRSLSLSNVGVMIICTDARARLLLRAAREDRSLLGRLRRDIDRLRKEPSPLARTLTALLDAQVAVVENDAQAAELFEKAETIAMESDMAVHRWCARRRRGEIMTEPKLVEESDAFFQAQGVARPERYVRVFSPA